MNETQGVSELLAWLAEHQGRTLRQLPVSPMASTTALTLLGRRNDLRRLKDVIVVDTRRAQDVLGWRAPTPARTPPAATVKALPRYER